VHRERGPEAGVAAAHDRNVRLCVALERRRLLDLAGFFEPPRRKPGL
jgi:hypothetical protein